MSQQQTVRITTTETSHSSALIINTGYLATPPGILKLLQFVLGVICVGIVAYHYNDHGQVSSSEVFFYLMTTTFLICTTILLISCLFSWSTGGIISKTIYELIYHAVACILILVASIVLIVYLHDRNLNARYRDVYKPLLAASIVGVLNALLYAVSTYYARRSYKGI